MSAYYILDALGDVLEENISVAKIDTVLSDRFIFDAVESEDLIPLIANYRRNFHLDIYEHDIARAHYLYGLIEFYTNGGVEGHEVTYFAETLQVINDWCAKYRRMYVGRYYGPAFSDFMMFCRHWNCHSVTNLPRRIIQPMFTYVFCREHFDRHPHFEFYSR